MTCITHFYQQGAQSYIDLAQRLQFLRIAQEHMAAYLDPSKWGVIRHPSVTPLTPTSPRGGGGGKSGGAGSGAAQLVMSVEDIDR